MDHANGGKQQRHIRPDAAEALQDFFGQGRGGIGGQAVGDGDFGRGLSGFAADRNDSEKIWKIGL
jgi:hypothetical protein